MLPADFFEKRPDPTPAAPAVLPMDADGNTEPLAFAILGLLAVLTLFPPLGLALCITALLMGAEEKRQGLYNAHSGATKVAAFAGIVLNGVLLAAEIALVVTYALYPTMILSYFV